MIQIELMTAKLFLPNASSLKDKRSRIRCIRDKWGAVSHLAVTESGFQDQWQVSQWSFVVISSSQVLIERTLAQVEQYLLNTGDFVVTDINNECL